MSFLKKVMNQRGRCHAGWRCLWDWLIYDNNMFCFFWYFISYLKKKLVPFSARLTTMSLVHQWVLILLSITFTLCDVNIIIVLCFLRPSTKQKTISFVTLRLIRQIDLWTDFATTELYPALSGKCYLNIKHNYRLGFWESTYMKCTLKFSL